MQHRLDTRDRRRAVLPDTPTLATRACNAIEVAARAEESVAASSLFTIREREAPPAA